MASGTAAGRSGNVIIIEDFMQNELALKGAKLFVYAVIYSFCQSCGSFYASVEYLAKRTRIAPRTVYNTLASLRADGLIIKLGKHRIYGTVEYGVTDINIRSIADKVEPVDEAEPVDKAATADKAEPADKVEPVREKEKGHSRRVPSVGKCRDSACGEDAEDVCNEKARFATVKLQNNEKYLNNVQKMSNFDAYFDDVPHLPPLSSRRFGDIPEDYDRFAYFYTNGFDRYGANELVMLSFEQHRFLTEWVGTDTTEEYIQRLDYAIATKPAFRSFSHFKTIKKWIMQDMRV